MVPSYVYIMLQHSFNNYNIRSQVALDIPLRKVNAGQKQAWVEIWTKISHNMKNVKAKSPFKRTLKKKILSKLCR